MYRRKSNYGRAIATDRWLSDDVSTLACQLTVIAFSVLGFGAMKASPKLYALVLFAFSGFALVTARRGTMTKIVVTLPIVMFAGWWLVSYAWTTTPWAWVEVTTAGVSALVAMVVVASILPVYQLMRSLLLGYYVILALTAFALITSPGDSMRHSDGSSGWHGSFDHKNVMTPVILLGMITCINYEHRPRVRNAALFVGAVLLLMSQSSTGLSALIACAGVWFWIRTFQKQSQRVATAQLTVSVFALAASVVVAVLATPWLVNLYGKDLSFSGRSKIWAACWRVIRRRPLEGYGIGGVWTNLGGEPTVEINRSLGGFLVAHSHNGGLEILLLLGAVGLGLYLLLFLTTVRVGWRTMRVDTALGRWVVLSCVLMLVVSFSENAVLGPWMTTLAIAQIACVRTIGATSARRTARRDDPDGRDEAPFQLAPAGARR
jgi:O-antigen ligase